MRRSRLFVLFGLLFGAATALAADPASQVSMGLKNPVKPAQFDFSTSYQVTADYNSAVKPRTYTHDLELSVSREIRDYTLFASSSIQYQTIDGDIYRANEKDQYFQIADVSLGGMRTWNLAYSNALTAVLTEDVFTSDESRFLGYRSVTSARGVLNSRIVKWLKIKNTVGAGYIWNRYRYAPVSAGTIREGNINPDAFYSWSVGPLFQVLPGLQLGAAVMMRGTRYLDGSNLYDFGNSFSLLYTHSNWSLYAKYINKGYADRGETNLWFADQYRKLAQVGAILNF